jgi:chaperonin GroEL (HSP60 family)
MSNNRDLENLESIRKINRIKKEEEEEIEWSKNQCIFLKNKIKEQNNRIDALEELIVQLIFQVQKQSNNEWKVNWSSV